MSKSLHRPNRQFGYNLKNTLQEHEIQSKLAQKPRNKKKIDFNLEQLPSQRHEMKYFDEVMKYALTTISYPHILKNPQKVKRDIEALLHQITQVNGHNCIWHENFMNEGKTQDSYFCNPQITLEKRTALIDWIIAIHKKYSLREETLYLTIKSIDDHCLKNNVPIKSYQLVGIASLFMAAKFEEIELPRFKDYHRLIESQFTAQQMIQVESQILHKTQFSLTKKVSSLWYMQAFAVSQILFPKQPKYAKRQSNQQQKENRSTLQKQPQRSDRFDVFMKFSRYVLNIIQLDYKITTKYKQDIIGISTLLFVSLRQEFNDSDGKSLLKHFLETKVRLIEQNETTQYISRLVKKCVKKIQILHQKRGQKRFETINQKFSMVQRKK